MIVILNVVDIFIAINFFDYQIRLFLFYSRLFLNSSSLLGLDQYMKQSIQEGLFEDRKVLFEYRSKETPKLEQWWEVAKKIGSEYAHIGLRVCGTDIVLLPPFS